MKRVLFIADPHCGHVTGLTPTAWQFHPVFKDYQAKMWAFFMASLKSIGKVDHLVFNGDLTEGKGDKNGGHEVFISNMLEQAELAVAIGKVVNPKHVAVMKGTPYHVKGKDGTDYEQIVADKLGGELLDSAKFQINNTIFNVRHKISRSSIPHGQNTPIARARLWDVLWSDWLDEPKSHVIIRSHVHYHAYCGGPGWLGMTLPSLQGKTEYGAVQCEGIVHFGLVWFDVDDGENQFTWDSRILNIALGSRGIIKL